MRHRTELWLAIKNIGKSSAQDLESFFACKNGECCSLPHVEGANVVEAEDVVGVSVRKENSVEALDPGTESLLAKIWRRIDDDVLAAAREQEGRAETVIVGVARSAHTTLAAKRGHAHRSAGAEDREFEWIS